MIILFVHGMGSTRFDFLPNALRLKRLGYEIRYFSYFASLQSLEKIKDHLRDTISAVASSGEYALVGHSLGGVLLRDTLLHMPSGIRQPKHLFLLGSPIIATKLNKYLNRFAIYNVLFGQCGQLVASDEHMSAIGIPDVIITCIAGTKGFRGNYSPFGAHSNDGLVLDVELRIEMFADVVRIHASHPILPACKDLSSVIHNRLKSNGKNTVT